MEPQIIALLLSRENFEKAKALVTKDMFDKKYKTVFDAKCTTIPSMRETYQKIIYF